MLMSGSSWRTRSGAAWAVALACTATLVSAGRPGGLPRLHAQARPPRPPFDVGNTGSEAGAPRTRHLTALPSTTERAAVPGGRLTLRVLVQPGPRIHVYAPGEKKYQSVSLTVEPATALRLGTPTYPPPESLFFAPLAETVLVFSKPFEILQEVTIDGSRAGRKTLAGLKELTIRGRLSYQACDDQICFLPTTLPLEWRVPLEAAPAAKSAPAAMPAPK
jgi:hypothetical protein